MREHARETDGRRSSAIGVSHPGALSDRGASGKVDCRQIARSEHAEEAEPFGTTVTWMAAHLPDDLTVEQMAARAIMSPRTFARRFRTTFGTSPYRWLLQQRIALAQRLLETTDGV